MPLELVAERAGVGRGTLYRNFKDREALALAIFSREVDRFEEGFDAQVPIEETLGKLIREGAPVAGLYRRIAGELHQRDRNLPAFEALRDRLEAIIAPALEGAQARGELRPTLTPRDVVLAMQMAGGLLLPFMTEEEVAAQTDAALSLLFSGIRAR